MLQFLAARGGPLEGCVGGPQPRCDLPAAAAGCAAHVPSPCDISGRRAGSCRGPDDVSGGSWGGEMGRQLRMHAHARPHR